MEIEVARSESITAVRCHRHLAGQGAVVVAEDLQRARFLRFCRGRVVTTRHQDRGAVIERHPYLMAIDAGVDRVRLRDLGAERRIGVDAVDLEAARIAERDQYMRRRYVGGHMDRSGRQRDRRAVRGQFAGRADRKGADIVARADETADPRGAVAGRAIQVAPRSVRPAVVDIGRQGHRAAPGQRRTLDIDLVVGQLRPDRRIKLHPSPGTFRHCDPSLARRTSMRNVRGGRQGGTNLVSCRPSSRPQ